MQSLRNAVFELARAQYDTIDMAQIAILLDISYDIAGAKSRKRKRGTR